MALINFGSINIDHIYSVPHFVAPGETLSSTKYQSVLGGKGANQSIACAKAGCETKHVGAVHSNDASYLEHLIAAGVNCEHVNQQTNTASGHAIIQVNQEAENAIVLFAGANHIITNTQIELALANATSQDWVLLQNETNAIADIIHIAASKGVPIAFNPAPMTNSIANLPLHKVDLLFVNEIEAMQLSQTSNISEAILQLSEQFPNTKVILTMGKEGVCYLHKGTQTKVAGFAVDAVDTTAAGDTFTGYFLAHYIESLNKQQLDPKKTLRIACAAAALCVTKQGAAPSIPSAAEVDNFLAK